jgi:hypothetical protein
MQLIVNSKEVENRSSTFLNVERFASVLREMEDLDKVVMSFPGFMAAIQINSVIHAAGSLDTIKKLSVDCQGDLNGNECDEVNRDSEQKLGISIVNLPKVLSICAETTISANSLSATLTGGLGHLQEFTIIANPPFCVENLDHQCFVGDLGRLGRVLANHPSIEKLSFGLDLENVPVEFWLDFSSCIKRNFICKRM